MKLLKNNIKVVVEFILGLILVGAMIYFNETDNAHR